MPRVFRRRRNRESRPAGRRWTRGSGPATQLIERLRRPVRRPSGSVVRESGTLLVAPVSPAIPPGNLVAAPTESTGTIPLLPGERTPDRRLKFAIANGCTIGSLVAGMVAVFLALPGTETGLRGAAVALLACVVLDGCDGGLARRFNVASPFGAQLDSLADLSSFGVATGIVTYQWLTFRGAGTTLAAATCVLVAVCAAIRLARFNVSPRSGSHFHGVPTTMCAAVLALAPIAVPSVVPVVVQVAFVGIYALAMVTPFPYPKLTRVLRLPAWVWAVPAIGAMVSPAATFVALAVGYLVIGPILWFVHRRSARPALARVEIR